MNILNFVKLLSKNPSILLVVSLRRLATFSTKSAKVVEQISKKLRNKSIYKLVSISQLPGFSLISETQGGVEDIILPRIVGLSNGGSISVNMQGDYLCKINNVSFATYSDFLRDENGQVANEKLQRKMYDFLIPIDRDLIELKEKNVKLLKIKDKIYVKVAFNLMGTHSRSWSHFLVQYYPKLQFLNYLPKLEDIDLIILKNTDTHIKYLIEYELKNYPHVAILEVDEKAEIVCEKLYHVSLGTFLGDHGYYSSPLEIQISKSTIKFWKERSLNIFNKNAKQSRKIFIGRKGKRSLNNYTEVLNYFIDMGFEEVFPHLLSMEDKIKMFNEAKYVVGPASSGFINTIFSQTGTKILVFINNARSMDALMTGFLKEKKCEFWLMTGKDDNIVHLDSNYKVPLNEIKSFLDVNDFFDNKNLK